MQHGRLGASDLIVSPVGLGCRQLSNARLGDFWGSIDFETEKRSIDELSRRAGEGK